MSFQTSALLLSWVAILLLALVVSGLVRQIHALTGAATQRPGSVGLRPGAPAPELDRLVPLRSDRALPVLLLFLDADCRTCAEVLDEAARLGPGITVRALYGAAVPAGRDFGGVPVQGGQADLFERYDAVVTPFAVVVDRSGRVLWSEPIGSAAALAGLAERLRELAGGPVPATGGSRSGGEHE